MDRGLAAGGPTPRALQGWPFHAKLLPAGLRPSVGSCPWTYQGGPAAHSLPHTGTCLLRGLFFQELSLVPQAGASSVPSLLSSHHPLANLLFYHDSSKL